MTATAYKTTRDRLRGILLEPLLDGDLNGDVIAYKYAEYRVDRVLEACQRYGIRDLDAIQDECHFMDVEEMVHRLEAARADRSR